MGGKTFCRLRHKIIFQFNCKAKHHLDSTIFQISNSVTKMNGNVSYDERSSNCLYFERAWSFSSSLQLSSLHDCFALNGLIFQMKFEINKFHFLWKNAHLIFKNTEFNDIIITCIFLFKNSYPEINLHVVLKRSGILKFDISFC